MNKIMIVSDFHCGSHYGLLHPRHWSDVTPEPVKWLWDKYLETMKIFGKMDLLILNGDLIDGRQSRAESTGLYTANLGEQVEQAIECIEPFAGKAARIIRTTGTSYHEGYHSAMNALDKHFGIDPVDTNRLIMRDIMLDENLVLNVKHQPDGGFAIYRGTVMDREIIWRTISETVHYQPRAHILIRSHLHHAASFVSLNKEIHITPCWCLQQPYARMRNASRWLPDIGATIIRRDKLSHTGWNVQHVCHKIPVPDPEYFT